MTDKLLCDFSVKKGLWIIFWLAFLPNAWAVPYLALYGKTSCSHCHLNPTGGGMRNRHGVGLYSEFSIKKHRELARFKGEVGDFLKIGGDLRLQEFATIESPRSNSFTIPWATLYLAADPINHLTLYTDTDLANTTSREAYGLLHNLPSHFWFKFGRLNIPYGLRLPDDTTFIRSDLGLTFRGQDLGIEAGLEPGPFTFALAVTNGVLGGAADDNDLKAASFFSEGRTDHARLGLSFLYNSALNTRTTAGGSHIGFLWGRWTLQGEFDLQQVRDKVQDTERTALIGYGEIVLNMIDGLYVKGVYDGTDGKIAGSGVHHRIGGGFDFFPIPHLETTLLYRIRIGSGTLSDDQIMGQIHAFF